MLHYVTLGSNDLVRSKRFYDPVMQTLGLHCNVSDETDLGYGATPSADVRLCRIWILKPVLKLPTTTYVIDYAILFQPIKYYSMNYFSPFQDIR